MLAVYAVYAVGKAFVVTMHAYESHMAYAIHKETLLLRVRGHLA
jgi:hypothetical protein